MTQDSTRQHPDARTVAGRARRRRRPGAGRPAPPTSRGRRPGGHRRGGEPHRRTDGPGAGPGTLRQLNQAHGFDCMGCAWPDPDPEHRSFAEFCENGAKAVAEEGDHAPGRPRVLRRRTRWSSSATWSDFQLGQQGRITEPMVLREGGTHYEPISWDDAIDLVATTLRGLDEPGPGGVLHERPGLERGGVHAPAVRARLRHQQPARLLEHVPRVDLGGARREHRHRQGVGEPATTSTRPSSSSSPGRTRAPTTRAC